MVGRQHCQVKQLSFTAARWLSFKAAMLGTFSPRREAKLHTQWSILFSFLIYEIKDAYLSHVGFRLKCNLQHLCVVLKCFPGLFKIKKKKDF
jgi:hypothetical protein